MSSILISLLATTLIGSSHSTAPNKIYDFKVSDIDGNSVNLKKYRGKVLLVVNVASKCGYTPQYEGLEKIYNTYSAQGFDVLGFPANNFGSQEPGTDTEIKEFCTSKYSVTFPMFSKISVKGDDEASLYKWLIAHSNRPNDDIEWNFSKFLIGRHGQVLARFKSKDTPESDAVQSAIKAALASS